MTSILHDTNNHFGDIIIDFHKKNYKHIDLEKNKDKIILFTGFPYKPNNTTFLSKHPCIGNIYSSFHTKQIFPRVKNGSMYAGCSVVFINKNNKIFTVIIENNYYNTPVGMCNNRETIQQTAIRKVFEETGLNISNLKKVAFWSFNGKFGGILWNKRVTSFYGFAECPINWNLENDINIIHFNSNKLLVFNIDCIDHVPNFNDGHYYHLIKEAINRINGNITNQQNMHFYYLKKFKFLY